MPNYNFLKRLLLPQLEKELPEAVRPLEREAVGLPAVLTKEGEVLGEGTSKALPKPGLPEMEADVLSPNLNDVNLPSSLQEKWNKYYKPGMAVGGAGLAGTALALNINKPVDQMLNANAGSPPSTPVPEDIQVPESEEEKALKAQIGMLSRDASRPDAVPPTSVVDFGQGKSIASLEKLKQLQQQMNDARQQSEGGRIGAAMATGMSGVANPFEPIFAARDKNISDMPEQYLKQVSFEKEDPNSPQSEGYRSLAKSMGFDIKGNASAADLERQFPQLANIYNQRQAQAARKDMQRDKLEEMKLRLASTKDQKNDQQKNKFIQYAQTALGKEFGKYQTLENAFNAIEQASGDSVGAGDVAVLYNFIKSLDPESVVREGEIALGQRGMSLAGRLRTATLGQITGEMLDPKFRRDVMTIARRMKDQGHTTYNQTANTIRDTARQRYSMSEDELGLIDPLLNRQQKAAQQMDKSRMPVSEDTKKLINSRSEAENRKRLEELQNKYGKH